MSPAAHHLVQANLARMKAPLEDPSMVDFVARLDHVNAVAEVAPGFVWRLQTEEGNATDIRIFEDDGLLFNMSVWESVEALHDYVYRSIHLQPIRERSRWFEPYERPHLVLWWIPSGILPTVVDAEARFERLWRDGPGPEAFTFKQRFAPPV